jgi:hypothetical protein
MIVQVTMTIDTIINGRKKDELGTISTVVVCGYDYLAGVVVFRVIFT